MKLRLEYSAILDVKGHESGGILQRESPCTIAEILDQLGIRKEHQRRVMATVNKEEQRHSYLLQDGDEVFLFVLASGG